MPIGPSDSGSPRLCRRAESLQCDAVHGLVLHLHAVALSICWAELFLCGSLMMAAVFWLRLLSVCMNASIKWGGEVVAGK